MFKKSSFTVTADTPVNAETIRLALEADKGFGAYPQYVRDAVLALVPEMPTAMADWLEKPVTTESTIRAKMAFIRLSLAQGFVEKMVQAMPKAYFDIHGSTREDLGKQMRDSLQTVIDQSDELVAQIIKRLEAAGLDDAQIIQQNTELPKSVKKAQREGWLTVGKLLLLYPASIIKND